MKTTLSLLTFLFIMSGCKTTDVVVLSPQKGNAVLVFRHDDNVIPAERKKDAFHDVELIRRSIRELQIGYQFQGRFGRMTLTISSVNVPEWKKMIDKLHSCNELMYYTKYGVDEHECGLALLQ